MAIERGKFIEVLADSYSAYYTIKDQTGQEAEGLPLAFQADYYSRDERYWLTKSVKIWANETNEFAYVFSAEEFDPALVDKCVDYALAEGLPRVRPHKEHQYTNIKVIFVCDRCDQITRKAVEKKKFSKSYRFSLHGFSELHAALVDLSASRTYTNRAGYRLVPYFKKLFASREGEP